MSEKENDIIINIIGKQLAGEASADEKRQIADWCAASAENKKHFDHLKTIFEKASLNANTTLYNSDVAWEKVRLKLHDKKTRFIFSYQHLRIAASVSLLCAFAIWGYRTLLTSQQTMELASTNTVVKDSLPDGTQVVLNKRSELLVTYNATKKKGKIKLKGEGSFEIKHDAKKELIVEAGEVFIRDIGTIFNVRAYAESNFVEVSVQEGEVQMYTKQSGRIHVKSGDKCVYNKLSKKFTVGQADSNVLAYKTGQFVFEDSDLQTVEDHLNSIYDKKIRIGENLKACRVTVTFKNETIETIAEILAETLALKLSIKENQIILEGEGCE
jgi:transmembrane sensor